MTTFLRISTLAIALLAPAVALASPTEKPATTDKSAPGADKPADKPADKAPAKEGHHTKKTEKTKKTEEAPKK